MKNIYTHTKLDKQWWRNHSGVNGGLVEVVELVKLGGGGSGGCWR